MTLRDDFEEMFQHAHTKVGWPVPWEDPDSDGDRRLLLHRAEGGLYIAWICNSPENWETKCTYQINEFPEWPSHATYTLHGVEDDLELKCWLLDKGLLDEGDPSP